MRLSVILPTCNERDELAACLDALAEHADPAEVIVVNGPSSDGTSGMIREREDVDVLVECTSRNLNVARNVGLREAGGEGCALVAPAYRVQPGWFDAVVDTLAGNADVVTGPAVADSEAELADRDRSARIRIIGGNLALTRPAITALDGFDEYLMTDGAEDLGQRVAGQGVQVTWHPDMAVRRDDREPRRQHRGGYGHAWQGTDAVDWGAIYRSLAYRVVKNQGLGVRVIGNLGAAAGRDGLSAATDVVRGRGTPSAWAGNGVTVVRNAIRGCIDGYHARRADGTPARNPHGLSRAPPDVVAGRYDRRQGQ